MQQGALVSVDILDISGNPHQRVPQRDRIPIVDDLDMETRDSKFPSCKISESMHFPPLRLGYALLTVFHLGGIIQSPQGQ